MAAVSWLKYAYLARLSQPRGERQLYRLVKRRRVYRIVELGVGSIERAAALIAVAQRYAGETTVTYAGLDWFDARTSELPTLTLKQTHCRLQPTGAAVRLVPGEPGRALASAANALQHTGLLLISAAVDDGSLSAAWFYLPRMLDSGSVVLRERLTSAGEPAFEQLSREQIVALAGHSAGRRAA